MKWEADNSFFIILLFLYFDVASLSFVFIRIIGSGSSGGFASITLSIILLIFWFSANLLLAVSVSRWLIHTFGFLMALTMGMLEYLKVQLSKVPDLRDRVFKILETVALNPIL